MLLETLLLKGILQISVARISADTKIQNQGRKNFLNKIWFIGNFFYLCVIMSLKDQHKQVEPTKSELEILQVLWDKGPSTVREVNNELLKQKEVNYATTLKLMQIMADKGILVRDESGMKHIYIVAEEEQKTKAHLLEKFVNSMYKGSMSKLVIQMLGNKKPSQQDLDEIKELIKKLEE